MRVFILVALIFALAGCSGGSQSAPSENQSEQNATPIASAGADFTRSLSSSGVMLNGGGSQDSGGGPISFSWRITAQPGGAGATLSGANSATPTLMTATPGVYQLLLTVRNTAGAQSTDAINVTLVNNLPVISLTSYSREFVIGENPALNASASSDANGHALTFTWRILNAPAGSTLADEHSGAVLSILFDALGEYRLQLEVSDGFDTAIQTLDPIEIREFIVYELAGEFADAEFDKATRRVVMVAQNQLTAVDPDGTEHGVTLPHVANAVSVSPSGGSAAVAHNQFVSRVDLNTYSVAATHATLSNIGDIVLDAGGVAHSFPSRDQWVNIESVNLATGSVFLNTAGSVYERTKAKLHPSGTKMYAADNGLSPSDVLNYTISAGRVTGGHDSPYHGDYPFCGDLWMGPAGDKILSRCRIVVHTAASQPGDLTFDNQLMAGSSQIQHASSRALDNIWLVIENTGDGGAESISIYDVDSGVLLKSLQMPFADAGMTQRWFAKFVFAGEQSNEVYVLAVDDPLNPMAFAMIKLGMPPAPSGNLAPMAVASRYATARIGGAVALDAGESADPEGEMLTFEWALISEPAGSDVSPMGMSSDTVTFMPIIAGVYEFELIVSDGVNESPIRKVTVNAFDVPDDLVHRLEGDVADLEYSKSRNEIVYLSATDRRLYILSLVDLSETVIPLDRIGYSVGISPDGLRAAVSHPGLVSLIDLATATIADTQETSSDWGDVVLDNQYRAHVLPNRDQHVALVSIDFQLNQISSAGFGYAGEQVRMHPTEDWVYGADRNISPSDFEKWDVSALPSSYVGDSPYHGDYPVLGDIWISEDGDRLLVAGAHAFYSDANPAIDMTYIDSLEDDIFVRWADHSTETNEWAAIATDSSVNVGLRNTLVFYDDSAFTQSRVLGYSGIPTASGDELTTASRVFHSDDGSSVVLLLEGPGLADNFALQIID